MEDKIDALKKLTYEEFEKEADKTSRDIYKKVLENFPEIKEGEVGLKDLSDNGKELLELWSPAIIMIDILHLFKSKEYKLRPTIYLDESFQLLPSDMKEAILAHELGHYIHDRKKSIEGIRRYIGFKKELRLYWEQSRRGYLLKEPDKNTRRHERLKKWDLLCDKHADEEAAKRGYGEPLLALFEWVMEMEPSYAIDNTILLRIKNLEKIL